MAKSYSQQIAPSSQISTTEVFEVGHIMDLKIDPSFKSLLVKLHQNINKIVTTVNIKDSAYYIEEEYITGQLYLPNPNTVNTDRSLPYRPAFRKTINFGAMPNSALKQVAHGISVDEDFTATRIYATATDTVNKIMRPVPNEWITVDATNVNITSTADWSAYTTCYVVIEYIKN